MRSHTTTSVHPDLICMRWRSSLLLVISRRLRSNAPTGGGWLWSLMSRDCESRPRACNAGYWEDSKCLTVCDEAVLNHFWLDNKKAWAELCLATFSTWGTCLRWTFSEMGPKCASPASKRDVATSRDRGQPETTPVISLKSSILFLFSVPVCVFRHRLSLTASFLFPFSC